MKRQQLNTWLIAGPVLAVLLWSVVFPNVTVVAGSFEHGLEYWRRFAASPTDMEALTNTLVVAF